MKLAVLADIHGNYHALQRVTDHLERWRPDSVVVAGDIVSRGPRSLDCLEFIQHKQQTRNWQTVRGNHEDYVISFGEPDAIDSGPIFEIYRVAYWTYHQLGGNVSALQKMPFQVSLTDPGEQEVRIVHASMRNNRDGIFPRTSEAELRQKLYLSRPSPPVLVCVGHTHWPLLRQVNDTLVANVGAVGLPFDGDPRAAYAQLTWRHNRWSANIVRLNYDREAAIQDFYDTGFLTGAGPLARLILDELRTAHSRLYQWMVEYEEPTLAGEISLQEAVTSFLIDRHGAL